MTSMNFVFRPSSKEGRNEGSLSLRLIHNSQVKTITLNGCRLYDDEWDKKNQKIIYPTDEPERIQQLEQIAQIATNEKLLLETYLSNLQKQGRYSILDLVGLYRLRKDESKLMGYAESLALELERRGQLRTARAYRTITRGIVLFNNGKDIPLGQINACLIKDFEAHLKAKGRLPNTISYYMRNLRSIYNKALVEKRISNFRKENPFTGIYTGVTKTMKRALSLEELKKIHELDFSTLLQKTNFGTRAHRQYSNLEKAQDYFYFSFYARGMSFVDLAYLRKDNIRGGFIRYVRKKTGRQIEVRISPEIQEIIDSFSSEVRNSSYVFPIIKQEKNSQLQYETALRRQNIYLKKLAKLSGVSKPISTHWARHSWATIGKQENVPLHVLSECLGHASEKTTLIYLGSLDNYLLDAANEAVTSAIMRSHSGSFV